ncbi:MAG: VWA domain-containing protein [Nitrospirae bacterium]|nr:VWA domain-containing protein [Nitrospirota bacterium]
MIWESFHFLRPWWFATIPLVAWLVYHMTRRSGGTMTWKNVCDSHLLPHVLVRHGGVPSSIPWVFVGVGWVLAIVALAGPTWMQLEQPVVRAQSGLVLVLDLSRSMDAEDVRPSRLTRAKHKVLDILKSRKEGQTGLIVYSAEPFVVSPLTDDADTIRSMVPILSTDLMPIQGSQPYLALEMAAQLLTQSGMTQGDIILITDSVEGNETLAQARTLRSQGFGVSVLGVGTSDGAPIPMAQGGFLKDGAGAIVIPKLDQGPLESLASAGGGYYASLQSDDSDLQRIVTPPGRSVAHDESDSISRTTELWQEEGPWLVLGLVALCLPAFRQGWFGAVLVGLLLWPHPVQALTWEDVWWRADQQGAQQLQEGHPEAAAPLFADPQWKGTANYQAGDFEQAAEAFGQSQDLEGMYNQGNALARGGKYPEALESYEKVLQENPEHEDAQYNANLIRELLKQQESESQQQDNQQGQGEQQSEDSSQSSSSQGDQSNQEQGDASSENAESSNEQQAEASQDSSASSSDSEDENQDASMAKAQGAEETRESQEAQENESMAGRQEDGAPEEPTKDKQKVVQSMAQQAKDQESKQATAQWLRRIPDDPGGLLRRKFLLELQRRKGSVTSVERPW